MNARIKSAAQLEADTRDAYVASRRKGVALAINRLTDARLRGLDEATVSYLELDKDDIQALSKLGYFVYMKKDVCRNVRKTSSSSS
jgi:hypothetical protein